MRFILVVVFLFTSVLAYADTSNKPCAIALEWWLRGQGKFIGAQVSTKYNENKQEYKITKWVVQGVQKPNKNTLEQIIDDYNAQYVEPKTLQERVTELEQRVAALEGG